MKSPKVEWRKVSENAHTAHIGRWKIATIFYFKDIPGKNMKVFKAILLLPGVLLGQTNFTDVNAAKDLIEKKAAKWFRGIPEMKEENE